MSKPGVYASWFTWTARMDEDRPDTADVLEQTAGMALVRLLRERGVTATGLPHCDRMTIGEARTLHNAKFFGFTDDDRALRVWVEAA